MRLFVAIELGEEAVASAASQADTLRLDLQESCPDVSVRWAGPAGMHLTLVFIGELAEPEWTPLASALAPPFPEAPFDLGLAAFGAFPAGGPPRTLWMGVSAGAETLAALHHEVTRRLVPLGYSPETRPYSPHLTVGRVKEARGRDGRCVREIVGHAGGPVVSARIDRVTLFRSHLSPRGSTYEALMRVPLLG
jgi:2'-5' RNA ligase